MNMSVNTFKVLAKLGAVGGEFERKQATHLGANTYMMTNLRRNGLIERASGACEWRITDKGYRLMTEFEKLLAEVA